MKRIIPLLVGVCLAVSPQARSQSNNFGMLRGLRRVSVIINLRQPEATRLGIDGGTLNKQLRVDLAQDLPGLEMTQNARSTIVLNVDLSPYLGPPGSPYQPAVSVRLEVDRPVTVETAEVGPGTRGEACVWHASQIFTASVEFSTWAMELDDDLGNFAAELGQDYRTARSLDQLNTH